MNAEGARREKNPVVRLRLGLAPAVLLLAALLLSGCARAAGFRQVSLHARLEAGPPGGEDAPAQGKGQSPPLRVAIANVYSPKANVKNYQPLVDYLGQKLGRPAEMVQRSTYAEVNDLVRSGYVDLAFVCTYAYVEGQKQFGMEAIAAPRVNGQDVYYSYIIVPGDSPVRSLADLRGRTFAFTDPLSNTGRLVPETLLMRLGESPDSFFKKYVFTYSHDRSIQAVADHLIDAAAVDSLVYNFAVKDDPRLKAATHVIDRSEPFGTPPAVVNPRLDPAEKQRLTEVLLEMSQDPQGRKILTPLMIDAFVAPDDHAYDSIRRMAQKVRLP